jgi:hypothetical protein
MTNLMIETERTFIFSNLGGPRVGWCEGCGAEAPLMHVADAAREAGLSVLTIYQLLEDGLLHVTEDKEGRVLICLNSLFK